MFQYPEIFVTSAILHQPFQSIILRDQFIICQCKFIKQFSNENDTDVDMKQLLKASELEIIYSLSGLVHICSHCPSHHNLDIEELLVIGNLLHTFSTHSCS